MVQGWSLSSVSGIGINVDTTLGEPNGAEVVPEGSADIQHEASVLGAETVVCRCIETCIAEMDAFFCNSLGIQKQRAATERFTV